MSTMPNETSLSIIVLAFLCAGIIYWTYCDAKKEMIEAKNEKYDQAYMKKIRIWRVYFIAGIGLFFSILQLLTRFFNSYI